MEEKSWWQKLISWFRGEDAQEQPPQSQPTATQDAAPIPEAASDMEITDDEFTEDDDMDYEEERTETTNGNTGSSTSILTPKRGNKREQQLAAMEESFNRLLEVLESLNDNVENQNRQQSEIITLLNESSTVMKNSAAGQTRTMEQLTQEVKNQSASSRQMSEFMKLLPDLSREQLEKLGGITRQLESSAESSNQLASTFNKFDSTFQGIMDNTRAQTMSLANMGQMLEDNEKQVKDLMDNQTRRFTWLIVGVIITSLATIGVLIAVLFNVFKG